MTGICWLPVALIAVGLLLTLSRNKVFYGVVSTCGVYHDVTGRATGRHSRYTITTTFLTYLSEIQLLLFIFLASFSISG